MRPPLLDFSERLYAALLRFYPPNFRQRFAAEMEQVFQSLCIDAYTKSGGSGLISLWLPVLWDGAWGAIYQWWLFLSRRRMDYMQIDPVESPFTVPALSRTDAAIAGLPFLLYGISVLISKANFFEIYSAPLWQVLLTHPFLIFNWLVLIGLGLGILLGSPRWAVSYLGWSLLFVWWWSGMMFYGYTLGWKIWLPLIGVVLAALLIKLSWQPLRNLIAGIWADWTLLSFAIYILYSSVYILYDENHHPYLLVFIALTILVICMGVWGYFRSESPLRRVLALLGGLILAAGINAINEATWDFRAYYGLPQDSGVSTMILLIWFGILALIMLVNGLLTRWRLNRTSRPKAS